MNNLSESIGENLEYVKIIVDNKIELAKINGAEKSAKVMSTIILSAIIGIMVLMGLAFIGVGVGLYLGHLLNSYIASFTIVGGGVMIVALLLYVLKRSLIVKPIFEYIVNEIIDLE